MTFLNDKNGSNHGYHANHNPSGISRQSGGSSKTGKIFEKHHLQFMGYFSIIFLFTVALLAAFGFLPSELQETSDGNNFIESVEQSALGILQGSNPTKANEQNPQSTSTGATSQPTPQQPLFTSVRLSIPVINVNTVIRNPVSTNVKTLDYELTQGVVRYPGSGTVDGGNMFLFGHSTGFSIVQNKAYKVFNEIKTLTAGDEIYVEGTAKLPTGSIVTRTFIYKVRDVTKVSKDETLIKFDTTRKMLTLVTCNSFGAKSDRYVVQADFVGIK